MKIELVDPDSLPIAALSMMQAAIDRPPKGEITAWEFIEKARNNQGSIYLINDAGLKGVIYMEVFEGILNIPLMSCENVMDYRDEISVFVKDLMKNIGVANLCVISRYGWHKMFKDLKPVGTIYTMGVSL